LAIIQLRRFGSAALDLCFVASGRLDGYYERGIWPWDLTAGSVMVEEAGGKLTNYRGGKLDLDVREIVASNARLHSAMTRTTHEVGRSYRFIPPHLSPLGAAKLNSAPHIGPAATSCRMLPLWWIDDELLANDKGRHPQDRRVV